MLKGEVLITGASGFLGKAIVNYFKSNTDTQILTLGRRADNDIRIDLATGMQFNITENFELIIHAAGKAHMVPHTDIEKQEFHIMNVYGTANLLSAIESSVIPKYFVFISSVAVYGQDVGNMINEDATLAATDPYGISKIEAEKLILAWCKKNNVICTILRLPLIAGTHPPGNLKAMINGIKKSYYFNIDGGKAQKSIVLADDVAKIIPIAATIGGIYNLTDGYHPSFFELSKLIAGQLNKSIPLNMPLWLAKLLAKVGDIIGSRSPINSNKLMKIISPLTFDDSKAKHMLGWEPTSVLKGFEIE